MWMRNLLFLGLVGGGIVALGANLMPPREPKPVTRYDAGAVPGRRTSAPPSTQVDASFRAAVGRGRSCSPPPPRPTWPSPAGWRWA